MNHQKKLFRVAVLHWRTEFNRMHGYWADSGCGELTREAAEAVYKAGRANQELCRIVPADAPILRAVP
jgi:hypothetical protein